MSEMNHQEQIQTNGGACVMLNPEIPPEENTVTPAIDGAAYDPAQPMPQESMNYMRSSDGSRF